MSSGIASDNDLIDRIAACIRIYGSGQEWGAGLDDGAHDELIEFAHGHSGEGWYLSCAQYPDEGAEFIGPLEYGALVVARAIVAEERQAIAGDPKTPTFLADGSLVSKGKADELAASVSFEAKLMALGSADVLAEDLAAHGSTPVLIFHADVEEVRKAGRLLRQPVRLTTGADPELLELLIEARNGLQWYRTTFPEAEGRGDDEVLARIDARIAKAGQ